MRFHWLRGKETQNHVEVFGIKVVATIVIISLNIALLPTIEKYVTITLMTVSK